MFHFQNDLPDSFDSCLHQVHIHIIRVILELGQDSLRVSFNSHFDQNFDLLQLKVEGVIKLTVKNFGGRLEDSGFFLQDEVDISQGDVLDFRLTR